MMSKLAWRSRGRMIRRMAAVAACALPFVGCGSDPLQLQSAGHVVQHDAKVHLIFWGKGWQRKAAEIQRRNIVLREVRGLRGSPLYGILTQYPDQTGPVNNDAQLVGVWNDPSSPPRYIGNEQAIAEVRRAAAANGWTAGIDQQFVVLPDGIESTEVDPHCGWHYIGYDRGKSYPYSLINSPASLDEHCFSGTSPASRATDETTRAVLHEIIETVTDPVPRTGWVAPSGDEAGDKCNFRSFRSRGILLQSIWDQRHKRCATGQLTPPFTHHRGSASLQ